MVNNPPESKTDPAAQWARKLAHELNSPLDGVLRFVTLAQRRVREKHYEDIERYLADAEFGLQRIAEIVRELTEMAAGAAPPDSKAGGVRLDQMIEQAVHTFTATAQVHQVRILVEQAVVPPARVDVHLYQVLCNLIKNGIEAMPEGGTLTVATGLAGGVRSVDGAVRRAEHHSRLVLIVRDTGHGIAPEHAGSLFVPLFTTKPQGQGMGLKVCKEILGNLGGSITLRNRAGERGCEAVVEVGL